ncbi:hypothetical protein GCM10022630_32200 [Thermobifida alba]
MDHTAVFGDLLPQASVYAEALREDDPMERAESLDEVEARVIALDAATGEERWRRVWTTRGFLPDLLMPRTAAHSPRRWTAAPTFWSRTAAATWQAWWNR